MMLTNSIITQKFKLLTTSSSIHSRLGGEVAKTHYILLYRASSGGNKSSHNRTDSTSTTSTYQRKY